MYQQAVNLLEHYKRRLGRQFNRENDPLRAINTAHEYNETEDCIAALTSLHTLHRKSKPYKLKVPTVQIGGVKYD